HLPLKGGGDASGTAQAKLRHAARLRQTSYAITLPLLAPCGEGRDPGLGPRGRRGGTATAAGWTPRDVPQEAYPSFASLAARRFLPLRHGASRCQSPAMMQPNGSIVATMSARRYSSICRRTVAALL